MKKRRYKLVIEYDGTNFSGWQIQENARTVQEELEKALSSLFDEPIRTVGAGRTDAGVHAKGQVVHFDATKHRELYSIFRGLNSLLPDDIAVLAVEPAAEDFHARYSAIRRVYAYRICRRPSALWKRYAWIFQEPLNLHDMQRCAERIRGEHSFRAFCSTQAEVNHYKCYVHRAEWTFERPHVLRFHIEANRFLHNMVRVLVGTMVEVGLGKLSIEQFEQILESGDRTEAGRTAPAQGLVLEQVIY